MSNKARVKSGGNWASDEDAGDLLAGILDETATAASAEQQRLEQELAEREAAEKAEREAEETRKREEAEAKLSAEADRQAQLQEKRTARLEAIKVEELKAKGEWVDPAEIARKEREEAARQAALQGKPPEKAAELAPAPAAQAAPAPAPEKKSNAPLIALAAVFAAVIGAVGVIFGMGVGQYSPDQTPYQKVAMAPVEADTLVKVGGFVPLPEAASAAVASNETSTKTKSKKRRKSRPKKKRKKKMTLDLGGDSLF